MEYKLSVCEECGNLLSVLDNDEPIYECPVCGTLNERNRVKKYKGKFIASSELMDYDIDVDALEDNDNVIELSELPQEVMDSLYILLKYGWTIKFKGNVSKD